MLQFKGVRPKCRRFSSQRHFQFRAIGFQASAKSAAPVIQEHNREIPTPSYVDSLFRLETIRGRQFSRTHARRDAAQPVVIRSVSARLS